MNKTLWPQELFHLVIPKNCFSFCYFILDVCHTDTNCTIKSKCISTTKLPTKKQKPISKLRGTHRLCGITFPNIIKSCSILKFIRACSSI